MKNSPFFSTLSLLFAFMAQSGFAQFGNYQYADSTQILLVFENEQDTAAINELKNEWNAVEIGSTPLTRIHLWQIPLDTVNAYGGPIGIQNHSIGKAIIKGDALNLAVSIIYDDDDDDDDEGNEGGNGNPPCYPPNIFACQPGNYPKHVAFTDTGFSGYPTGGNDAWETHHAEFMNRIWQNPAEAFGNLYVDDDQNGFTDDAKGWDFVQSDHLPLDENAHGTHVASIAANLFDLNEDDHLNKLLILKTNNPIGEASTWDLVQALDYALRNDVKIVNMSLAYLSTIPPGNKPSAMEYLMEFAKVHRGTLFVAAAGNDSLDLDQPLTLGDGTPVRYYPANLPNSNLIVVAAGTCDNELASFSNFGATSVDLAAPGVDIYGAILSGNYGYSSGTSAAAPHVAAAAALAGSQASNFNWKKIKSDILTQSTPSAALEDVTVSGKMLAFCDAWSGGGNPLLVTVKASQILCVGGSTTLVATPAGGTPPYNFTWSNGGSGAVVSVAAAGSYTVTVTAAGGATATETVQIFSSSAPLADVPVDTIYCNETAATLTIQNAVQGAFYSWSNGATTPGITVSPVQTTTYVVTTTLPTGCTSVSNITLPVLRVTVDLPPQTIQAGDCAWLEPGVSGGTPPFQFHWDTGESYPAVEKCPPATQTYAVTVTSNESCTGTATVEVTVVPPGSPLVVSPPNGQAGTATQYAPTAIISPANAAGASPSRDENLKVYPNPASEYLQVEMAGNPSEMQAAIFSVEGRQVRQFELSAGGARRQVYVGDLPPGFYFLKTQGKRAQAYFVKE